MKLTLARIALSLALTTMLTVSAYADGYRITGRLFDGGTSQPLTNVEVQLLYSPLSQMDGNEPPLLSTNTNASGEFDFGNFSGELEGEVRVLQLATGYAVPLLEQIRLSVLTPTNQVIFRAGPAAAVAGTITVTNGTTDLTKFRVEVNATEGNVATNGTFLIPELPAYQQTMRLIYQDGFYFDERVVPLPALTAGITNTMQIYWHRPKNSLTTSGVLRAATGNVLGDARIRFLGKNTGIFVGMKTDANGNYAIYDLPNDCYTVRAFVGRYGIEQRALSTSNSILCVGIGGGDSVGDGIPDAWRRQFFGGTGTTTNSQSCASCDPDNDGVSNLDEYRRGTDPTDGQSKNITLYANSNIGSNSFDGLTPMVVNGHGPKHDIIAAAQAAYHQDTIQAAAGEYREQRLGVAGRLLFLRPAGTVYLRP